jgi:hypothetical protein
MKKILLSSLAAAALAVGTANAQLINDATGDIASGIATAGGTLDIVSTEVLSTSSDVTFKLTVNGDVSSGGNDCGNFMIGIATGNTAGTTTGNAWNRPINLDSPIGGMNYWIGSWVNGTPAGGAQLWNFAGGSWTELTALAPVFSLTAGAQSVISLSMPLSSIGITSPTLIYFDAYSSGSTGTDGAVDALSRPTITINNWGDSYTSSTVNGISSVTVPEPSTYALLGLSALAVGGYLARRRARK